MFKNPIGIVFLVLLAQLPEPWVDLDFEGAAILEYVGTISSSQRRVYSVRQAYPNEPDKEHRFIQDALPYPELAVAAFTEGAGMDGGRGFEMAFPADEPGDHVKERMELYMAHGNNETALKLGDVAYLGYALYIDPANPVPSDVNVITQCWQLRGGVDPLPALNVVSMWMWLTEVDGGFGYRLHVKSEGAAVDGAYAPQSILAGTGPLHAGWNTLIYRFEPNHINQADPGRITMWINTLDEDQPTVDRVSTWGVTPQNELPEGLPDTGFLNAMDVRIGMYRPKQSTGLRLVFDNVRYGFRFKDVLPINRQ